MNIRIFQLKDTANRDKQFVSYETAQQLGGINADDYRLAYSGDILIEEAEYDNALNKIFSICNNDHPVGYHGHSLSVSDVIEVREWNKYFYVDSFGFKDISSEFGGYNKDVDSSIRILICEPDRHPYYSEIPKDDIKVMQEILDGYFEVLPYKDGIVAWCNEDGLIRNMKPNRIVNNNLVHGTFFFSDTNGEEISSLSPEQMDELKSTFYNPVAVEAREGF